MPVTPLQVVRRWERRVRRWRRRARRRPPRASAGTRTRSARAPRQPGPRRRRRRLRRWATRRVPRPKRTLSTRRQLRRRRLRLRRAPMPHTRRRRWSCLVCWARPAAAAARPRPSRLPLTCQRPTTATTRRCTSLCSTMSRSGSRTLRRCSATLLRAAPPSTLASATSLTPTASRAAPRRWQGDCGVPTSSSSRSCAMRRPRPPPPPGGRSTANSRGDARAAPS